jgi:hypothetical protein
VDGLRPSFSAHVRWREHGAPGLVPLDPVVFIPLLTWRRLVTRSSKSAVLFALAKRERYLSLLHIPRTIQRRPDMTHPLDWRSAQGRQPSVDRVTLLVFPRKMQLFAPFARDW